MREKRTYVPTTPQVILVLLILSLCLNVYLLVSPALETGGEPGLSLQELQEIREAGVYGPDDVEIVEGSLFISAAGVKLQNAVINGDLILTSAIGDGSVELSRVTVRDSAMVEGGGEDTVVFEDAVIGHLLINRADGKVRVVLKGKTVVEKITIKGAASLSAERLSEEGQIGELNIETAAAVELEGVFDLVNLAAAKARVTLVRGRVEKLAVGAAAEEACIAVNEGAVVELLAAGAPLSLESRGEVGEVIVAEPGLFKFAGNVEKITAGGRGIFLEFAEGSTETVVVKASEGTVMIHLATEAVVKLIRLDGAAGITGEGSLERVVINCAGTTIERKPGAVELAEGVEVEIAGEKIIKEKPKQIPSVGISAIGDRVIGPGESTTISLAVSPGDAKIMASSNNASVAAVSLSGKSLTIKGGNSGTATITVRVSKQDYNSASRTFKVTVDPVKDFKIGDSSLTPGKKVVTVTLRCADPQNYTVTVAGISLNYYPDKKAFGGEVPENDAKRGNVRVARR